MSFSGWDSLSKSKEEINNGEAPLVDPYGEDAYEDYRLLNSPEDREEEEPKPTDKEIVVPRSSDLDLETKPSKDMEKLSKILNEEKDVLDKDLSLLSQLASKAAIYRTEFDEALEEDLKDGSGGLIYKCKIYRNGYNNKTICVGKDQLKPRRPIPIVYEEDFFSSLTKTKDQYIFQGKLNGWPALTNLELLKLEYVYSRKVGNRDLAFSRTFWTSASSTKPEYPLPGAFFSKKPICIKATLRAPKFTEVGYSRDNPGFVWWFKPFRPENIEDGGPKVAHGMNILTAVEYDAEATKRPLAKAVRAHFYAHRYAKKTETPKDKITYHTGVLLEWDHGLYCTNVELAYMYGIGGYGGKSNWVEDRDEPRPLLWSCLDDSIKAPWRSNRMEIRLTDMNVKDVEGFKKYLNRHTKRFLKPTIKYSGPVRLTNNNERDIAQYLLNYAMRDTSYSEEFHNCQSLAADFYGFICAKPAVEPLYPVKLFYKERRHLFLYDATMFTKDKKQKISTTQSKAVEQTDRDKKEVSTAAKLYQKLFGV